MPELEKAKLQQVTADQNERTIGEEIPVQFNPSSLKLKLTNQVDGGRSRARQRRQQTGQSSNILSMDLVFDTADESDAENAISVRTKTALVEQFVIPAERNRPDPPPRLRFHWDDLIFTGIVENVEVEFDHFAPSGTPLRAKVTLSIKEQNPEYQFLQGGPGSRTSDGSSDQGSGAANSTPGSGTNTADNANNTNNGNANDQSAPALDGESPAEFAARQGLDPAAWRGLAADLSGGLGLEAGVEVGFSANLNAGLGIGVSVGVQAQTNVSLQASVGLSASNTLKVNGDAAGKAITAAGGVTAAIDAVAISESTSAAATSAQAFRVSTDVNTTTRATPAASNAVSSPLAGQSLAPEAVAANVVESRKSPCQWQQDAPTNTALSSTRAAAPKPPPLRPDPRSISYGLGVPLQPLRKTALDSQTLLACGPGGGAGSIMPPFRREPTTSPWVALPQRDKTREQINTLETSKHANPCDLLNHHDCNCD